MKKTKKEKNKQHGTAGTSSEQAKPATGWSFELVMSIIVLLGVLYHWGGLNHDIVIGAQSAKWPRTNGTVKEVRTAEHSQSNVNARPAVRPGGTTRHFYEVVPTYEYTIEGKNYINNKVTSGGGWFYSSEVEAKQKAASVKQSLVAVYYDPAEPSKSVLERGVADRTSSGMLVTIPLAGVAMGIAFYQWSGRRMMERRRRMTLSIAAGIGLTVILSLLQWFVLSVLI